VLLYHAGAQRVICRRYYTSSILSPRQNNTR
jgi:hypothetical protein